jgi:outer membrane protein assembly factor BamB
MVIDLGDVTTSADQHLTSAWSPSVDLRRIVAGVVVVLSVMALVVASALPAANPLPLITSLPIGTNAQLLVEGSEAVIVDDRYGQGEVSVYDLPSGSRKWTSAMTGSALNASVLAVGTMVMVTVPSPEANGGAISQGFDLRTGKRRWSLAGFGLEPTSTGILFFAPEPEGSAGAGSVVQLIDPVSGAVVWTTTVPDACSTMTGAGGGPMASSLIEFCDRSNEMTVVDLATGRIRIHRRIDLREAPAIAGQTLLLMSVGDTVMLSIQDGRDSNIAAFRLSDLTPLWSNLPITANATVEDCAPHLCVDEDDGTVVELNPVTGAQVGTDGAASMTLESQNVLRPVPRVIEVVVVPLGQRPLLPSDAASVGFAQVAPPGQVVVLLPAFPTPGLTLWIAEQGGSPEHPVIRPLRKIVGIGNSCVALTGMVACTITHDRVSLFRLP